MDKSLQQQQRILAQQKAEKLSLEHKHLVLCWATGVGKGLAVMRCIAASSSSKKWLIVVPELIQIENYKKDLVKHGYDKILKDKIADIICYASLHLWAGKGVNLALNECHRLSDFKTSLARSIHFDQIISDSATISSELEQKLWEVCPSFIYSITLNEAIRLGILPEPAVYLVPVELDNTQKVNKVVIKSSTYLYTDWAMNQKFEKDFEYWNKRNEEEGYPEWIGIRLLRIGSSRKKFLAECKTSKAQEVLSSLQDSRLVCFCGSIEQCNDLGGKLAIHSKRSKKINLSLLDAFNRGEINQIYFNKMGKEGLNLEDIQAGVIVQLDGGKDEGLSFLQRMGRVLRSESPSLYILYAKGTQDEKYLRRALKNIDEQYIKEY